MYQRIRKGLRLLGKDILALLPAIAALAGYWTVTHLLFDRFCPMQILLGLPCPGCGMTRALGLVLTGHLAAAWKMQPPAAAKNTLLSVYRQCTDGWWRESCLVYSVTW